MNVILQLLMLMAFLSFFVSFISMVITFYLNIKLMRLAEQMNPSLAEKAYYGNFFERAANAKNMNKILSGENPEFAKISKNVDIIGKVFVTTFFVTFILLIIVMFK